MPTCDLPTEVYSRVCGYHRPVSNWNQGKREEFLHRRPYKLEKAADREKAVEIPLRKLDLVERSTASTQAAG